MAEKQPNDVEDINEETIVSPEKENDGGGWWDSLYSAAKSKSAEVLESVKRDLGELTTIVTTETNNIVLNTTNVVKETLQLENPESTANTMKKSVSSFLDQMSSALNPLPDDSDEESLMIVGSDTVTLSRLQAQIYTLANDPNTFILEIDDLLEKRYKAWLDWVKSGDSSLLSNEKLTKILNECTPLRENYEKLVPNSVSHADFWYRFLFRKALLEDEDAKQQRRLEKEKQETERIDFNKELSEKEQEEILSSYDQERRVSSKSNSPTEDMKKDSKLKQEDIPSTASSVTTSSLDKDEWVKDFDIEDIEPSTK
ncbi:Hypothetical protein CINCED_3A002924 [Cinara cedri]|uniref:BSD domain-containing protein n=1 Tax=Cinara cedri TaxID=506608 RepID=A0A5E4NQV3_9HEMI|nr:Hypothetical protein CINCED_3A002924 [Cinara cedri]